MYRIIQLSKNITYKTLLTISEYSQEENTHPQQIHSYLFQGIKLMNYTTGAGTPLESRLVDTH